MTELLAAAVAAVATVTVALAGALLGRRWGLPGLGRAVETEQKALIDTLRGRLEILEDQLRDDERRIAELEGCTGKLADIERQLRDANADIADLNRALRRRQPAR